MEDTGDHRELEDSTFIDAIDTLYDPDDDALVDKPPDHRNKVATRLEGFRPRLHRYVFKSFRFHFVAFSNRATLDCVFKCLRFHDRFHRFRVNRR